MEGLDLACTVLLGKGAERQRGPCIQKQFRFSKKCFEAIPLASLNPSEDPFGLKKKTENTPFGVIRCVFDPFSCPLSPFSPARAQRTTGVVKAGEYGGKSGAGAGGLKKAIFLTVSGVCPEGGEHTGICRIAIPTN